MLFRSPMQDPRPTLLLALLVLVPLSAAHAQHLAAKGSCAIRCADGSMQAWGNNGSGELGTGDYFSWNVPVGVDVPPTVASIAPGGLAHTAVIMTDARLWTWGFNFHGQLGNGTNVDDPVPAPVLDDVVAAATGNYHTLAVTSSGTVWASGINTEGTLGDGTTTSSTTFVQTTISDVVAVGAGLESSVALKSDGTVWAWGLNNYGQLGSGPGPSSPLPVQVAVSDVVALSAGRHHVLLLRNDGTVWSFGADLYGALGQGTVGLSGTPAPVLGLTDVLSISAGEFSNMAVLADGSLWAWGRNAQGQLGIGTTVDTSTPVQVSALPNVLEASSGVLLSMALAADGSVWTWGDGSSGALGNGTNASSNVPVQVTAACAVSAGVGALQDRAITVGPNPSHGAVDVRTTHTGPLHLQLNDIHGRTLLVGTVSGDRSTVDLSAYPPGVYPLVLHTEYGVSIHRLVKL